MDDETKWVAILFLGFAVAFFSALVVSEYMAHMQKMECIKVRGDWSDKACHFPK